jgi:hypothetical protein
LQELEVGDLDLGGGYIKTVGLARRLKALGHGSLRVY